MSLLSLRCPASEIALLADALHQAAVAGKRIGEVIDDCVAQACVDEPLSQRHADGICRGPWPSGTCGWSRCRGA